MLGAAIGDEVVHRRADDRHVDARELCGVLRVGRAGERKQPRVVGLVPERLPARERVDHRPDLRTPVSAVLAAAEILGRMNRSSQPVRKPASDVLVDEIQRYLAAVDTFRREGCGPRWRSEPCRFSGVLAHARKVSARR